MRSNGSTQQVLERCTVSHRVDRRCPRRCSRDTHAIKPPRLHERGTWTSERLLRNFYFKTARVSSPRRSVSIQSLLTHAKWYNLPKSQQVSRFFSERERLQFWFAIGSNSEWMVCVRFLLTWRKLREQVFTADNVCTWYSVMILIRTRLISTRIAPPHLGLRQAWNVCASTQSQ